MSRVSYNRCDVVGCDARFEGRHPVGWRYICAGEIDLCPAHSGIGDTYFAACSVADAKWTEFLESVLKPRDRKHSTWHNNKAAAFNKANPRPDWKDFLDPELLNQPTEKSS